MINFDKVTGKMHKSTILDHSYRILKLAGFRSGKNKCTNQFNTPPTSKGQMILKISTAVLKSIIQKRNKGIDTV